MTQQTPRRTRKKKRKLKSRTLTGILIGVAIVGALGLIFSIFKPDDSVLNPKSSVITPGSSSSVSQPTGAPTGAPSMRPSGHAQAKNPLEDSFEFTPKPVLQRSLTERFGKAEVVSQSPESKESNRYFTRSAIYRTNFKYPLLRVDDRFEKDDAGVPKLVSRNVRVADHLLVKLKGQTTESDFARALEGLNGNFKIRKKMATPGHFLVQFDAPNSEALDRARDAIKSLSGVESVDPDFIVSVD